MRSVSVTITVPVEDWQVLDGLLVSLVGESSPYDEEDTYRSALRLGGAS